MRCVHSYFRLALTLALVASGIALTTPAPPAHAQAPDGELLKVVILSRHGVRSPLVDTSTWSGSAWPTWTCGPGKTCCPGELTERGGELARLMGDYYRRHYGLFDGPGCPNTNDLYFWADTDQRTYVTGINLLRGLLPAQCDFKPYLNWQDKTKVPGFDAKCAKTNPAKDAIFHPVTGSGAACPLNPAARNEMQAALPGLLASTRAPRELTQCKLQCCLDLGCQTDAWWKACGLTQPPLPACRLKPEDRVSRVQPAKGGNAYQLAGPPRIAGTFAELLLLEYGNRFPMSEVGFGRTKPDEMDAMFRTHTEQFAVEQRTPTIAALQGARLLSRILDALQERLGKQNGDAPPTARFVAFAGHDTNIANLGALLHGHWLQPPYQKDQTPPAGALIFELRKIGAQKFVRVLYAAQSPEVMREYDLEKPASDSKYDPVVSKVLEVTLAKFTELVGKVQAKVPAGCWN